MKKKNNIRKILSTGLFISALLLNGCSMALESDPGEFSNNSIRDISGLLNRSTVEKMMYMGGSVLYSPKNSVSNQLQKGVKIAFRQGEVISVDPGDGQMIYLNTQENSVFGYLNVVEVSSDNIKVEVFNYSPNSYSETADAAGVFNINLGESVDIDNDGNADLSYTRPMAGRKGYKTDRWLNFICDADKAQKTTMFSVIPMQYSRSVYPGGIIGINTSGNYIVNKYDIGTNNRALVSNISYGDYIIDMQANTVGKYVGEGINSKGARSVNDSELKIAEAISEDSTVEDFYYNANEFIGDFKIEDFFNALPSQFVTTNYGSNTLADNVAYLNNMVRQRDFLEKILKENTERSPEVVLQVMNELSSQPLSSEIDYFLVGRHTLALLYPDACPDVDLSSKSLCVVFPWLYVDMGTLTNQEEIEETVARSISSSYDEKKSKEIEAGIKSRIEKYTEDAKLAHAGETDYYTPEFIEYEIKRDVLEKRFGELYSYNFLPLLAGLTSVQFLTDIVEQTNGTLAGGIGGHVSFANMNPDINIKLGILLKMELEDQIKLTISSTSLFAKKEPDIKDILDGFEEYKEKYGDMTDKEENLLEFFLNFNEDAFKETMGIDHWYCNWTTQSKKVEKKGIIKPSDDALSYHKQVRPISTFPLVFTFDALFDILIKTKAVVEFKDCYLGGIYLFYMDAGYSIDWGFRKKFLGIPLVWTFYADETSYSAMTSDYAGFAGVRTVDRSDVRIGGGVQVVLAPVFQLRAGVGVGADLKIATADATLGAAIECYAPLGVYVGLTADADLLPKFVVEATMDIGAGYDIDLQFYLKPPVISEKRWKFPLWSEPIFQFNVMDLRFENGKRVQTKKEIQVNKDAQRKLLLEEREELYAKQTSLNHEILKWQSRLFNRSYAKAYYEIRKKISSLTTELGIVTDKIAAVNEKLDAL